MESAPAATFPRFEPRPASSARLIALGSNRRALVRLVDQPMEVLHERPPGWIGGVALPLGEVRRMRQFENDRSVAGFDRDGRKLVSTVGQGRFRPNPARSDGARRPEHDDGLGRLQRGFDDLIERLARMQRCVPPDGEPFIHEALSVTPCDVPILATVRNEDVRSGQAGPLVRTNFYPSNH